MQSRLDQVDAALVTLEVVQSEQEVDLVVLEHGEGALDGLTAPKKLHIGQMDTTKNLRLTNTDCHSCKSCIKLVKHVALLRTLLADNSTLCATIDESLDRVAVHLGIDVEHSDVAKELWVVLHGCLVV